MPFQQDLTPLEVALGKQNASIVKLLRSPQSVLILEHQQQLQQQQLLLLEQDQQQLYVQPADSTLPQQQPTLTQTFQTIQFNYENGRDPSSAEQQASSVGDAAYQSSHEQQYNAASRHLGGTARENEGEVKILPEIDYDIGDHPFKNFEGLQRYNNEIARYKKLA